MGKTIYKLIDGKLVDVNTIPREEKKEPYFGAALNLTPGLNWGKSAKKTYISTDDKGHRKVYKEQ